MPKRVGNKWTFTDAEIDAQIARAKDRYVKEAKTRPIANKYSYNSAKRAITLEYGDGFSVTFPTLYIRELRGATESEIKKGYITKEGDAIHWDNLNAHYTVAGLIAQRYGTKEWMRELGKIGGSQTSASKAMAARINGAKGGRPRTKTAVISHSRDSRPFATMKRSAPGKSRSQSKKKSSR